MREFVTDVINDVIELIESKKRILICPEPNIATYITLKALKEKPDVDSKAIIFKFSGWTKPKALENIIMLCNRFKVDYYIFEAEDIVALILHRLKPYVKSGTMPLNACRYAVRSLILMEFALIDDRVPIIAKSLTDLVVNPEPRFDSLSYPLVRYTDTFLASQLDDENVVRDLSKKACELGEFEYLEVDRRLNNLKSRILACKHGELFVQPKNLDELLDRNICVLKHLGWNLWKYTQ